MANNYFCVDIGESTIKVADIKKNGNILEASSLAETASIPNFYVDNLDKIIDDEAQIISKLISNLKIVKKNVNVVIPDAFTYSQILEMPSLKEKELISAIKYQADQFIPMPIEETNLDIEVLYENEKEKKLYVLIEAAPKKLTDKIQTTIETAGLIPEAIENELSASSRFISDFYRSIDREQDGTVVFINFGFNSSTISCYSSNYTSLLQNHSFNLGLNLLLKELQMNLNLDPQKATEALKTYDGQTNTSFSIETIINPVVKELLFEINRFINSAIQKYQLKTKKIYLTNEAYKFPHLIKIIETNASIPSGLLNPYPLFTKSSLVDSFNANLSSYISTIGGNLR